jgi:hypothetical protein
MSNLVHKLLAPMSKWVHIKDENMHAEGPLLMQFMDLNHSWIWLEHEKVYTSENLVLGILGQQDLELDYGFFPISQPLVTLYNLNFITS